MYHQLDKKPTSTKTDIQRKTENNPQPDMPLSNQAALSIIGEYYKQTRTSAKRTALDEGTHSRIRRQFGENADKVKIYENSGIDAIGERGFANGNEIHLSPGVLRNSAQLENVLSHEMTHIAQQNGGGAVGRGALYNENMEAGANSGRGEIIKDRTLVSPENAPVQGNAFTDFFRGIGRKVAEWRNAMARWNERRQVSNNNSALRRLNLEEARMDDNNIDANAMARINQKRQEQMAIMRAFPDYTATIQNVTGALNGIDIQNVPQQNAQAFVNANLDALRQQEEALYQLQRNHMGAADDPAFQNLLDQIQTKYSEHYLYIRDNGLRFHAAGNQDQVIDNAANALWGNIEECEGFGDPNVTHRNTLAPAPGRNRLGVNSHTHNPLQGNNQHFLVNGFRQAAFGNLGRILSTQTGRALIGQLTRNFNGNNLGKITILRPVYFMSGGNRRGPGAVPYSGNNYLGGDGANCVTNQGPGTGTHSESRISEADRDSTVGRRVNGRIDRTGIDSLGNRVLNPQFIMTAHELTHSLHNITGCKTNTPDIPNYYTNKSEELATMYGYDTIDRQGNYANSALLNGNPAMQAVITNINEQRMRDEFGLLGRDFHDSSAAFRRGNISRIQSARRRYLTAHNRQDAI